MNSLSDDERERVALQRFEIIAPLLKRPLPRGAQKLILEELTKQMHLDAQNRLVFLGKRTIERYLSNYLKFGLEGLKPKVRPEQGSLKAFGQQALDEAVKIRLARPELSADSIIDILRSGQIPGSEKMCVNTLNRHLRRLGKDRPALKRWLYPQPRLIHYMAYNLRNTLKMENKFHATLMIFIVIKVSQSPCIFISILS